MPEFTKSYAINRIAELTEIGRSLDAENQQLEQKNKNLIIQISHYNKLLSDYRQNLQTTRETLRKACEELIKLDPQQTNIDNLYEQLLKETKEENANGD